MSYIYNKKHRLVLKLKLIEACGGKCWRCGYNTSYAALDFHHIIPEDKKFEIATKIAGGYSLHRLIEEVKKCALLCSNCHRELHVNLWDINSIEHISFNINIFKKIIEYTECANCGKKTEKTYRTKKYCSQNCQRIDKRKNWPDKETLEQLIVYYTKTEIAKMYDVSDTSVRKWIKAYSLGKPRAYSRKSKI